MTKKKILKNFKLEIRSTHLQIFLIISTRSVGFAWIFTVATTTDNNDEFLEDDQNIKNKKEFGLCWLLRYFGWDNYGNDTITIIFLWLQNTISDGIFDIYYSNCFWKELVLIDWLHVRPVTQAIAQCIISTFFRV